EKGLWRIPSHDDYPADASQQLGEAASALAACKTVNIESEDRAMHVTFGVVEPDPQSLKAGTTGVGKRVTMEDKSGKKVQVVIGKGIKDKPELFYARVPPQDRVYVVSLKTDKFSTKFEDWIEKDLLKLIAWDIERVSFNDYSIDELQGAVVPRAKIQVAYDNKDSKWKLDELEVFREGEYEPQAMADDEELNSSKLNDLKTALDDLKIVDVARKPEGLAADLRAGEELAGNREATASLVRRGFYLASIQGSEPELYSNEGEIRCGTKEGVEYLLRFGRISGGSESESKSEQADETANAEEDPETDKSETGANRFIMVTATFNEDLLTKPELTPLPEAKAPTETEDKAEAKQDADKTSASEAKLSDAAGLLAQADDEPADENAEPSEKKETADKKAGAKPAKKDKTDAKGTQEKEGKPDLAKPKTPEELERDRITKENERKQKEYDDKVKKGKEKVKELSDR
ncbi:MAG: hypothetical protein ACREHD_24425, partial [Pirellulales bacterium]